MHDNTLTGGALTNKPFLSGLPVLTLASAETIDRAVDMLEGENAVRLLDVLTSKQRSNLDTSDFAIPEDRAYPIHDLSHARNALARASGKPEESRVKAAVYKRYPQLEPASGGSDSRRAMDKALLTALGLDNDSELVTALGSVELDEAHTAKLLDAATGLAKKAKKADKAADKPVRTLEQEAADRGLVILDAEQVRTLQTQAASGAAAMKQLHEQRFDHAFTDAVKARKVTPAERDSLAHFYTLDAAATLTMLEARQPIVPEAPRGLPSLQIDPDPGDFQQVAQAGLHPGSHQLHQQVQAKLKELNKPQSEYLTVLEQIQKGEI